MGGSPIKECQELLGRMESRLHQIILSFGALSLRLLRGWSLVSPALTIGGPVTQETIINHLPPVRSGLRPERDLEGLGCLRVYKIGCSPGVSHYQLWRKLLYLLQDPQPQK